VVKVTSERLPDAQVVLNIEVEPEQVARAEQRAYQSLVNRVNVPGFRRGKAPRYLVERMIGGPEALRQEGIERLIPEVYREAIEQEKIEPIDQPELDVVSTDPLIVKAIVPVEPTIELGDYRTIRVPKVPVEVPYERINETIERMREQRTEWVPVERPVRFGDRLTADVVGTIGAAPTLYDASGQPLLQSEGRESLIDSQNVELEVDPESRQPVPGFHQELVGLAPRGSKRFLLSVPDDWPTEAQRRQSVLFQVAAHDVKEPKVPALDDEFARSVGEYETLDALREDVRERLRQQLEHEADHVHQEQVLKAAVEQSNFEMAPALIRREAERLVRNFEQSLARQRLSLDQYLKLTNKGEGELRDEMRPQAETNLKNYLVLREIAKSEGIEVTPDEVQAEIDRVSGLMETEEDRQRARQYLEAQRERGDIQSSLWERKVTQFLTDLAAQPADTSTDVAPADTSTDGAPADASIDGQPADASIDGQPADAIAAGGPADGSASDQSVDLSAAAPAADVSTAEPAPAAAQPEFDQGAADDQPDAEAPARPRRSRSKPGASSEENP
jgi:trigger factor